MLYFVYRIIFCKIQQIVLLGPIWEPEDPSAVQLPPNTGAGLLHDLVLFWLAPPQDTGQYFQSLQSPQVPLPVIDHE